MVETYVSQLDAQTAAALSSSFRAAVVELHEEGITLRWLRSFALLEEETHVCIVAARDRDDVVRLSRRVGCEHDHVVETVMIDAPIPPSGRPST